MDIGEGLREALLESLRSRALRAGQRLPTERALSEQYGLSRSTVRRVLMCQSIPPPPPGVDTKLDPVMGKTQREILEAHRADPKCSGCHVAMDPLGFGLEHYDPLGAWRADENGLTIDPSGSETGNSDATLVLSPGARFGSLAART